MGLCVIMLPMFFCADVAWKINLNEKVPKKKEEREFQAQKEGQKKKHKQ